jgi:phospholipase C
MKKQAAAGRKSSGPKDEQGKGSGRKAEPTMPSKLDFIDTVAVVIMENRSFDHMLGYLSLPPHNRAVDGIQLNPDDTHKFTNDYRGHIYPQFHLTELSLPTDPPHERTFINMQLGPPTNGVFPMNGFVRSYATQREVERDDQPPVMGYYTSAEIPITHFLAENFAICDKWFASLPASTQPNRLMAMSGFSRIDGNVPGDLPEQTFVYDWLTKRKIRWRVYHEGLPFLALMPSWLTDIVTGKHFSDFDQLVVDVQDEEDESFPQVIFIEPTYTDAPHLHDASDDHPPSSIHGGQEFLSKVYQALTSNPKRWARTLLIITYDEHGGFYDHVSPLLLETKPPEYDPDAPPLPVTDNPGQDPSPIADYASFTSTGVRVPAFVVSPLVTPGRIYSQAMDHTAILKLIGMKFGESKYSSFVDSRNLPGTILEVLDLDTPGQHIPTPPPLGYMPAASVNSMAFKAAAERMYRKHPEGTKRRFPYLWHF